MSSTQSSDWGMAPMGVGNEKDASTNPPDPDDPSAAPIVDDTESRVEPDPAYKDDQPVGAADADEDARRAGGDR